MENVKPSSSKVAFKWALISFIVGIILTYTFQFLDMDQSVAAKCLGYLPFIAFLLLAQKEFKDQLGGYLTFGEGFVAGLLYSVFLGIMTAVFVYIYLGFLSPQILEHSITQQQDKFAAQGLSPEQTETAMGITRKYGAIIAAVFTLIGTPIVGCIIALIGAAIFKKERSPLDMVDSSNYIDPQA